MTTELPLARPEPVERPRRKALRVPAFYPVSTRGRRDGWTIQRQADFLGMLAQTGSVLARQVGMSRKSSYQLRARPGAERFAAAWDAALGEPVRKVTPPARDIFCCDPLVRLVTLRGRYRGSWHERANGSLVARAYALGGDTSGSQVRPG